MRGVALSRRARNCAASTGAVLLAVAALWGVLRVDGSTAAPQSPTFAASVANLSERGGYFDTDNLISNERSYLQVVSDLKRRSVQRRRLHRRRTRSEFFVHQRSAAGDRLHHRRPARQPAPAPAVQGAVRAVRDAHRISRLPDRTSAATGPERLAAGADRPPGRVHRQDAAPAPMPSRHAGSGSTTLFAAPACRCPPRTSRPSRRFIGASSTTGCRCGSTARAGRRSCITRPIAICCSRRTRRATRPTTSQPRRRFQFVKSLQSHDRIVPVVGDISGPTALQAVGRAIAARGERLSVFYVSNVEFYLFGQGAYPRFVTNLRGIPQKQGSGADPIGLRTLLLVRTPGRRQPVTAPRPGRPARRV